MCLIQHLRSSIPPKSLEVWETCVSSKPALFQGCTECKRPIVIVKIVLPVTVVSFYIYVELLELVNGHNEIQFFYESIIVMKEYSEAKLISLLSRNDFDQNFI